MLLYKIIFILCKRTIPYRVLLTPNSHQSKKIILYSHHYLNWEPDYPMEDDYKNWFKHMVYVTYKNFTLQDFTSRLYSFLNVYMPLATVNIYEYRSKVYTNLSSFSCNNLIFRSAERVEVDDTLLNQMNFDSHSMGICFKSIIFESSVDNACSVFFKKIHFQEGSSIYIPLNYGTLDNTTRYINLFSPKQNCYDEYHLRLCDELREPLNSALENILLRKEEETAHNKTDHEKKSIYEKEAPLLRHNEKASFVTLDEYNATYIRTVIEHTNGRISGKNGAAALLGVPPTTLWSKMRKLNIKPVK